MNDLELLKAAINDLGTSTAVAAKIKISKTTLSLIRDGKYTNPEHVFARLRKEFGYLINGVVACPALKTEIHREVCKRYSTAVADGNVLAGSSFRLVQEVCPWCPLAVKR